MKLIDADALLESFYNSEQLWLKDGNVVRRIFSLEGARKLIANAPTVEREGWVSAEELQKVYDDMFSHKDIARVAQSLWSLIHAK